MCQDTALVSWSVWGASAASCDQFRPVSPGTSAPPNRQLLSTPHVLQAELGKARQQVADAQAASDRLRDELAAERVRFTAGVVVVLGCGGMHGRVHAQAVGSCTVSSEGHLFQMHSAQPILAGVAGGRTAAQ